MDKFGNISAGIFATDQTVTITATTKGKTAGGQTLSASCEVTVKKYVGPAIKLSSGHLSLRVGESRQLLVSYAQTNVASGVSSVALGHATNVSGNRSLACGDSLVSAYEDQVVIGKFNNNRADTILEVGNGSIETPSNAFEVYKNGNVKISGNTITIGNTTITEAQLQQLLTLL